MRLLFACCRWPAEPAAVVALADGTDWPRFAALARRHRVQALAFRALSRAGVPEAALLAAEARGIAADNLRLAVEAGRLLSLLAAADIPAQLIKGVALGVLAYGDLATKMGWDIDLLVPPDLADGAVAVMAAAGYHNVLPGPDTVPFRDWHAYAKDTIWRHPRSGIHVELHLRLLDNPRLLADVHARSAAQRVTLAPGLDVPTLGEEALFAYLCLHGAISGWQRLKWLADLAALLGQHAAAVEAQFARAQRLGAGGAAAAALMLAGELLGTPLTPRLAAALRRERGARLIAAVGRRTLLIEGEPTARVWGTLPIHLSTLLLAPGGLWAEARRKLRPDPRIGGSPWLYPLRVLRRRARSGRNGEPHQPLTSQAVE